MNQLYCGFKGLYTEGFISDVKADLSGINMSNC